MSTMFCYQCEQAAACSACTVMGVCGKDPQTAALQDLLIFALKGISAYADKARAAGKTSARVNRFTAETLFTTVTNVNFDPQRLTALLQEAGEIKAEVQKLCEESGASVDELTEGVAWQPAKTLNELVAEGRRYGIDVRSRLLGAELTGVQELLTQGLKGTAAYMVHAARLGKEDDELYAFLHHALAYLGQAQQDINDLLALSLECGRINLRAMELLDAGHTERYGHPEPTAVRITPVAGKAILVSGHDLQDLEAILSATAGSGINVYTHGEMLPAHAYPALRRYPHLVGNYGGAWQNQWDEFDAFPGAILMTTNCIQRPQDSYQRRIFTSGLVAWPGVRHIADGDFSPVIEAAREARGFVETEPERSIMVGFGHHAVLGVADKVLDAVKAGAIRHFFLIGGCDGAKPGRNYYTDFAKAVPADCVILTLACGKYRFNKEHFGEIGGIPRLLDVGQCNDAYSAIKIAAALAEALNCGVNDLPLSMVLSWYEQKAVAILLTLFSLGIRNIRLGPSLPACLTPGVIRLLQEKFAVKPIGGVQEDLRACLNGAQEQETCLSVM